MPEETEIFASTIHHMRRDKIYRFLKLARAGYLIIARVEGSRWEICASSAVMAALCWPSPKLLMMASRAPFVYVESISH